MTVFFHNFNPMKNIAVIGAGVAGISAAIGCAMKGHKVCVFEQGICPGGMATAWDRKSFHFEGCIHWIVGSTPVMRRHYDNWKMLGALRDNNPLTFKDPVYVFKSGDVELNLWRDVDRLQREMIAYAPEDAKAIRRFCLDIRLSEAFFCGTVGFRAKLRKYVLTTAFLARLPFLLKLSFGEYCTMFSNLRLRRFVASIFDTRQNALFVLYTFASFACGDNGYPAGGSTLFVNNMLERAKELGVEFHFRCRVDKVCVKDGKVQGLMCKGIMHRADDVIVASDTIRALERFFDFELKEPWLDKLKRFSKPLTCMYLSLGIENSLENRHVSLQLECEKALELAGLNFETINVSIYHSNTGYAPEGCSAMTVILMGDCYDYWRAARSDGSYYEKKKFVTEKLVAELERHLPEIAGKIKLTDLATPLTYERYCGTERGAWMGVWPKGESPLRLPGECRSVKGLHFAGFRTQMAGGLPIAMSSGLLAASKC